MPSIFEINIKLPDPFLSNFESLLGARIVNPLEKLSLDLLLCRVEGLRKLLLDFGVEALLLELSSETFKSNFSNANGFIL